MRIRLLLALAGLGIGSAVRALAQDRNTVDPQARQEIEATLTKFEEAFNKHDPTAMATLFTVDAVQGSIGERVVRFPVSKPSRKITQSISH